MSYLSCEFLMELTLSVGSISTLRYIFISFSYLSAPQKPLLFFVLAGKWVEVKSKREGE